MLDKWFTDAGALDAATTRCRRWSSAARAIPISPWPTRTGCARWSAPSAPTSARFHDASGAAIASSPTSILAVDKLNPQTAAKLVPPLGRWRRFGEARGALMRAELERIVATPGLSKDVFEQVSKSLA